jgi:hypothetical protein
VTVWFVERNFCHEGAGIFSEDGEPSVLVDQVRWSEDGELPGETLPHFWLPAEDGDVAWSIAGWLNGACPSYEGTE